jgi:arsenate reductase (thioredoxin)
LAEKVYNVLFLCTGNTARSIMSEALLNSIGGGRFRAYSAGSYPKGAVHPMTLELLKNNNLPVSDLRSKSWDEFEKQDSPKMDFIFTVCDNAAGEVCPVWPGRPVSAHWGIPDPAAVGGSDDDRRRAFERAYSQLLRRLTLFVNLPFSSLDEQSLKKRLGEIGRTGEEVSQA